MDNFNLKNYLKEGKLSEDTVDNVIDALYEKMQNMDGEDLDEFLEFYAPDVDNRDANAITDWVYGLSKDDAENIMDDLLDIHHAMGYIEDLKKVDEGFDTYQGATYPNQNKKQVNIPGYNKSRDYDFNSYYIDQIKRDLEEFDLDNEGENEYLESLARAILNLKK